MSDLKSAKQQVVSLESELSKRTVEAENIQRQLGQLQQSISKWNGSMVLDNIDFSEQIASARAEVAQIEKILIAFPDVKAELERRLAAARAELNSHQLAVLVDQFQQLADDETELCSQFKEAGFAFLKVADRLAETTVRKDEKRREISQSGGSVRADSIDKPAFFQGWVQSGGGVQAAVAQWQKK